MLDSKTAVEAVDGSVYSPFLLLREPAKSEIVVFCFPKHSRREGL
jgi:hypothetical protein